jgi:hypothetical protein
MTQTTEVGHTPGPWIAQAEERDRTFIVARGLAGDGTDDTHIGEIRNGLRGQSGANARLIAAAPEGLEANKLSLRNVESLI